MSNVNVLGDFVWHELMTTDPDRGQVFYAGIAPWTTRPAPHDAEYCMFFAGGRPVAGLMDLPDEAQKMGAPPSWLTYIATRDVDDTVRRAVGLGGRVLVPAIDVPTVGRFAVLRDPQGAVFAVIAFLQTPLVSDERPPVGDFSWHELATTDPVNAWKFYAELFGWNATHAMDMGPAGTYQMFGPMARSVGGIYAKPKEMPGPPAWLPYIRVADAIQVGRRIGGLGGEILNGPMEVPDGDWVVVGRDPQGATFAAHSTKPVAAARPARGRKTASPPRKKAAKPSAGKSTKAASKPAARSARKATKKAAVRTSRVTARKGAARKKAVATKRPARRAVRAGGRTPVAAKPRTKHSAKKAAKKR